MINVTAITGGKNIPSARFRFRQHYQPLENKGLLVREYNRLVGDDYSVQPLLKEKQRIRNAPYLYPVYLGLELAKLLSLVPGVIGTYLNDVTWVSRGLLSGWPALEGLLRKPIVLDVDDAVWLNKPFGSYQAKYNAANADVVIAGNSYIADWFQSLNKNVIVVPTAIDSDRFRPISARDNDTFVLGWTGTSGNFTYLYQINNALKRFFQYAKDARLLIVADNYPINISVPKDRIDFHVWTEQNEAALVQRMDLGIMPLPDNSWAKGKCSFKMLQYMACGIPVVVSPVGMNTEVLAKGNIGLSAKSEGEWLDALIYIYDNEQKGAMMGRTGRMVVERFYSVDVINESLATVLVSVL